MNKKVLGASLRRGVLTGTVAGFAAGWLAFVGHGKQLDALQTDASNEVAQKRADLLLPPIPAIPDLPGIPAAQQYRLRYGPADPLPRVVPAAGGAASTAAPIGAAPGVNGSTSTSRTAAPAPTFAPLPSLPPAPAIPAPTTSTSTARR